MGEGAGLGRKGRREGQRCSPQLPRTGGGLGAKQSEDDPPLPSLRSPTHPKEKHTVFSYQRSLLVFLGLGGWGGQSLPQWHRVRTQ